MLTSASFVAPCYFLIAISYCCAVCVLKSTCKLYVRNVTRWEKERKWYVLCLLWLAATSLPLSLLTRSTHCYHSGLMENMRLPAASRQNFWCSWYAYFYCLSTFCLVLMVCVVPPCHGSEISDLLAQSSSPSPCGELNKCSPDRNMVLQV